MAAMEDVLEVYSRPYDEAYPVVCMDEKPVQFFADFRTGFRSRKDGVVYEDYQYIRNTTPLQATLSENRLPPLRLASAYLR